MTKTTQNIPKPNGFPPEKYSFYRRKTCATLIDFNKFFPVLGDLLGYQAATI
jgi:hypothetical protein